MDNVLNSTEKYFAKNFDLVQVEFEWNVDFFLHPNHFFKQFDYSRKKWKLCSIRNILSVNRKIVERNKYNVRELISVENGMERKIRDRSEEVNRAGFDEREFNISRKIHWHNGKCWTFNVSYPFFLHNFR